MVGVYDFNDKLAFSRGRREDTDLNTLHAMIYGCESVSKTSLADDKNGVDYIATLRRGGQILIDAKARERGASKYWRNGAEVALEIWSVKPDGMRAGKAGWTLCEKKQTDLILFTFDPLDTTEVFLVSYQLLRMAFAANFSQWKAQYKTATQSSGAWQSECVFVPYNIVEAAINQTQRGQMKEARAAYETTKKAVPLPAKESASPS